MPKSNGQDFLYKQVESYIKRRILSGELKVGDMIETDFELMEKLKVSRITVRLGLDELVKLGMIKRVRGKGTFVCEYSNVEESLQHIRSFTKEIKAMGHEPGTGYKKLDIMRMPEDAAFEFELENKKEDFMRLERVRLLDEFPILFIQSYFPRWVQMPLDVRELPESVYEYLGHEPVRVEEKIRAIMPSKDVAQRLKMMEDVPCLLRLRKSFDSEGRIFEYSVCYYRGDKYTYTIENQVD